MLSEFDPVPTLAVADLQRARDFYEGLLGFTVADQGAEEGLFYSAGSGTFFVYVSSYAGTNKATAMSFQVPPDRFDAEVQALRDQGVQFLTFEMEGMTWADGVATMPGMSPDGGDVRAVWFTDPDGNILNIDSV